jgi:hypothetical protein
MNRTPILRRGERRAFHKWRWFKERRSGFDRRQRVADSAEPCVPSICTDGKALQ